MLDPSLHGDFGIIFGFTLKKAVELFDCDKPKVGKHILEFLTPLIHNDKKREQIDPELRNMYLKVLEIIVRRI